MRGETGFAREGLMAWCKGHGVRYVLGLATNLRLLQMIGKEMVEAQTFRRHTGPVALKGHALDAVRNVS